MNVLNPREKDFLLNKFGLSGKAMSLKTIAKTFTPKVSRERVRQIISKSMAKLKANPDVINSLKEFVN